MEIDISMLVVVGSLLYHLEIRDPICYGLSWWFELKHFPARCGSDISINMSGLCLGCCLCIREDLDGPVSRTLDL